MEKSANLPSKRNFAHRGYRTNTDRTTSAGSKWNDRPHNSLAAVAAASPPPTDLREGENIDRASGRDRTHTFHEHLGPDDKKLDADL